MDTICLKHVTASLSANRLDELGAKLKYASRNPTWKLNPESGSPLPRITITEKPEGIFHVYAECSLPKILYGHNSKLPDSASEIERGIQMICDHVELVVKIEFRASSAVISKSHLARDYKVGDAANRAVFKLLEKQIQYFPRRVLVSEGGVATTLYFNGKSTKRNSVICIYPKYEEVLARKGSAEALEAAQGRLRVEVRANTRTGVKSLLRRFKISDERELLTKEFNDRLFESLEREVDFPDCLSRSESNLVVLERHYPKIKAYRLFGFLEDRRLKGDMALMSTDSDRRNFNASRRDCEKAGVWLDRSETEE